MLKCRLACKEVQNLATVNEPRGFLAVTHAEDLVGGAQVLLYRRLGEEEVLGDLCVAESLGDQLQYLALADGERVEIRGIIVRYEVLEKLPGGDDLALVGHLHGTGYLIQLHPGVDETPGPVSQGGPGERQIHVQAEDQNGDFGVDPLIRSMPLEMLSAPLVSNTAQQGTSASVGAVCPTCTRARPSSASLRPAATTGYEQSIHTSPKRSSPTNVASPFRGSCEASRMYQDDILH